MNKGISEVTDENIVEYVRKLLNEKDYLTACEVIAKTAFEGGLHGQQLSTTSPEYGTDGSFANAGYAKTKQLKC